MQCPGHLPFFVTPGHKVLTHYSSTDPTKRISLRLERKTATRATGASLQAASFEIDQRQDLRAQLVFPQHFDLLMLTPQSTLYCSSPVSPIASFGLLLTTTRALVAACFIKVQLQAQLINILMQLLHIFF